MQQQIRGRLTCFCRACCDVIWPKTWCDICDVWYDLVLYRLSRLACRWVRQPAGAIGLSLIIFAFFCFTLSLWVSNSCRSNSWRNNLMATRWWKSRWWWSWCHAGDNGDHAGALEMEIKSTRSWPYHVTYDLHVMLILFMHLIMLRTTVAL